MFYKLLFRKERDSFAASFSFSGAKEIPKCYNMDSEKNKEKRGQVMKYAERIEKRQSIREYRKKDITPAQMDEIRDFFKNKAKRLIPEIDTELQIFTGDAGVRLEGVAGYGGKAFGAPAYLVLLTEKTDYAIENAGFIVEDLVLQLEEMGLNHCWLSVNDDAFVKKVLNISSEKEVAAIVAFGYGKQERTLKRLDIINPSNVTMNERKGHVAPKIAQEDIAYYGVWGNPVDWDPRRIAPQVDKAIYAASLAPSFLNRQPYRFMFSSKILLLLAKKEEMITENDTRLDLGATMLNFYAVMDELNGTGGPWKMGIPEQIGDTKKPDEYEIVAYYNLEN